MQTRTTATTALAVALLAPVGVVTGQEPAGGLDGLVREAPAASSITADEMAGHIRFLSTDLMRGRDTGSDEIRIAAEYLATRLQMAGAEPSGDVEDGAPTYFARFPLHYLTPKSEGTELDLLIPEGDGEVEELECELNEEFVVVPRGVAPGVVEAPVVFAGYGRPGDFEGLDVDGRIVLVVDGTPPEQDEEGLEERRVRGIGGSAFAKRREAERLGALALLIVHAFEDREARPFAESGAYASRMFDRPSMNLGEGRAGSVPVLFLEDDVREELDEAFALSERPAEPRALPGLEARFTFAAEEEVVREPNVIGLFRGDDEELGREVVIYTAHYDHVGVGSDGRIYNGADDNASGTAALLEAVEAFAAEPRPRRSVVFLWVSGEEKGLLGSKWWTDHMTLPDGYEIVADINIDMISRNSPDEVKLCPSDRHPAYSTLVAAAASACEAEGIEPRYDADRFYSRTDSYNFAEKGIPIVFLFAGTHEDYHEPGDDYEKADPEKAARIARVAYRVGWAVAMADEAPRRLDRDDEGDRADGDGEVLIIRPDEIDFEH